MVQPATNNTASLCLAFCTYVASGVAVLQFCGVDDIGCGHPLYWWWAIAEARLYSKTVLIPQTLPPRRPCLDSHDKGYQYCLSGCKAWSLQRADILYRGLTRLTHYSIVHGCVHGKLSCSSGIVSTVKESPKQLPQTWPTAQKHATYGRYPQTSLLVRKGMHCSVEQKPIEHGSGCTVGCVLLLTHCCQASCCKGRCCQLP